MMLCHTDYKDSQQDSMPARGHPEPQSKTTFEDKVEVIVEEETEVTIENNIEVFVEDGAMDALAEEEQVHTRTDREDSTTLAFVIDTTGVSSIDYFSPAITNRYTYRISELKLYFLLLGHVLYHLFPRIPVRKLSYLAAATNKLMRHLRR